MSTGTARPTKALITAGGLNTRFLPASKAVPKELFPVVDTPAIQYVAEEAVRAGLSNIVLVTGRGKSAISDHFDAAPEVEAALERKGDSDRLKQVRRSSELAEFCYVRQGEARGLGHAVLCGATYIGNDPFAVLLGDDLVDSRDPLLSTMIDVHQTYGGTVIALQEVPMDQVSSYGCVAMTPTDTDDVVRITGLVEKPPPEEAPSNLIILGRYFFGPEIFEALRNTDPGRGGEIQLTDAMQLLAESGAPVHGVVFRGRRYDTGNPAEYLRTMVRMACDREDLGPDFRRWLEDFVAGGV